MLIAYGKLLYEISYILISKSSFMLRNHNGMGGVYTLLGWVFRKKKMLKRGLMEMLTLTNYDPSVYLLSLPGPWFFHVPCNTMQL